MHKKHSPSCDEVLQHIFMASSYPHHNYECTTHTKKLMNNRIQCAPVNVDFYNRNVLSYGLHLPPSQPDEEGKNTAKDNRRVFDTRINVPMESWILLEIIG